MLVVCRFCEPWGWMGGGGWDGVSRWSVSSIGVVTNRAGEGGGRGASPFHPLGGEGWGTNSPHSGCPGGVSQVGVDVDPKRSKRDVAQARTIRIVTIPANTLKTYSRSAHPPSLPSAARDRHTPPRSSRFLGSFGSPGWPWLFRGRSSGGMGWGLSYFTFGHPCMECRGGLGLVMANPPRHSIHASP